MHRTDGWPWRDFGGATMTKGQAIAGAFYAALLHEAAGLGRTGNREVARLSAGMK